jgi:threonine dehydratase
MPTPEHDRTTSVPPRDAAPALDLDAALVAVRSMVVPTPLVRAPDLDAHAGRPVWLKLESLQTTGSFKVRGAAACLHALSPDARGRGVVTCSSGNHGRAVAFVAERLGVPARVFVPSWVDPVKLEAIRGHGARTELAGDTYDEAEARALACAREHGLTFVHPFDDAAVAAGQGTIALEILDALPDVGEVLVPLSGGGLAGGIGYALAARASGVTVTAVSATRARVMVASLEAGGPVTLPEEETLATALSGGIGSDNALTLALVRRYVHRHLLVDENAIAHAIRHAFGRGLVVEGGGAVALAALLAGSVYDPPAIPLPIPEHGERAAHGAAATRLTPETRSTPARVVDEPTPLVLVVSGGNLDLRVLARLVGEG